MMFIVMALELVVLVGLQASGKSTFFREHFAATHDHVSKDLFPNNRDRNRRQTQLIRAALGAGRSVVVDNTNPTARDRLTPIQLGRESGARIIGYFFESDPHESLRRNDRREGRARVPAVAIFATAKKLTLPSTEEGFDELFRVRLLASGFEINSWDEAEQRSSRNPLKPDERRGQLRYRARCCLCQRHGDAGGAWMASNVRELLGKHYDKDHLSYEEITRLDLRVVTEDGEAVSYEDLRGKIFRIVDRNGPSGYVVRNVETTRGDDPLLSSSFLAAGRRDPKSAGRRSVS